MLISLYREIGAKRLARLIDRSSHAIHSRAVSLGLADRSAWSKFEDFTVMRGYGKVGIQKIALSLKGRTIGSIYARAWRLGLSKMREEW